MRPGITGEIEGVVGALWPVAGGEREDVDVGEAVRESQCTDQNSGGLSGESLQTRTCRTRL